MDRIWASAVATTLDIGPYMGTTLASDHLPRQHADAFDCATDLFLPTRALASFPTTHERSESNNALLLNIVKFQAKNFAPLRRAFRYPGH